MSLLDLSDAEYWTRPDRDVGERSFAILRRGPAGFTWGVPSEIDLAERATLPVAGYFKCSLADRRADRLEGGTAVVAVRQESNRAYAGAAFRAQAAPQGGEAAPGQRVEFFQFDARARLLGLPWRDGTLDLYLLSFDTRSEARRARLVSKASRDPVVAAFLESKRRPGYPRPVWPPAGVPPEPDAPVYPHYRRDPASPALPAEAGIELTLPRVTVLRDGGRCALHGSFRLPVLERERVKPAPAEPEGSGWADVGDPAAQAVLPITLILMQEGWGEPQQCTLQVPVYEEAGNAAATGHFNLDLLELPGLEFEVAAYCLYLFCGPVAAGPFRVSLVTPDMLPPPGE